MLAHGAGNRDPPLCPDRQRGHIAEDYLFLVDISTARHCL